jgi:hypothetical protein
MIEKKALIHAIITAKTLVSTKPVYNLLSENELIETIKELNEPLALTKVR